MQYKLWLCLSPKKIKILYYLCMYCFCTRKMQIYCTFICASSIYNMLDIFSYLAHCGLWRYGYSNTISPSLDRSGTCSKNMMKNKSVHFIIFPFSISTTFVNIFQTSKSVSKSIFEKTSKWISIAVAVISLKKKSYEIFITIYTLKLLIQIKITWFFHCLLEIL